MLISSQFQIKASDFSITYINMKIRYNYLYMKAGKRVDNQSVPLSEGKRNGIDILIQTSARILFKSMITFLLKRQIFQQKRPSFYRRAQLQLQSVRKEIEQVSDKFQAYLLIWRLYFITNQFNEALNILEKCNKEYFDKNFQLQISFRLGSTFLELGNLPQSQQWWKKSYQIALAQDLKEYIQDCHQLLYQVYYKQNKISQAILLNKQILKYKPFDQQATYNLKIFYCQDEGQQQKIHQEHFAPFDDQQMEQILKSALNYYQQEKYSQAILCCKELIALNPSYIDSYLIIKDCYLGLSNYSLAIQYCNMALQIDPFSVNALSGLGQCYYYLNQIQTAVSFLIKSIKLNPNYINPFIILNIIYHTIQSQRWLVVKELKILQDSMKVTPNINIYLQTIKKLMGLPNDYYSFFDHVTKSIQKDIISDNSSLLIALRILKISQKYHKFQFLLDIGLLYILLDRKQQTKKYYRKIMFSKTARADEYKYQIVQRTKAAGGPLQQAEMNQFDFSTSLMKQHRQISSIKKQQVKTKQARNQDTFYIFTSIYTKVITKIHDGHYRILLGYFLISQMFLQDQAQAMRSIIWIFNQQSSEKHSVPALISLVYQYQTANIEKAILGVKFANRLAFSLNQSYPNFVQVLQKSDNLEQQNIGITNFKVGLINSLRKCLANSKKIMRFMPNQKVVCQQLNQLIFISNAEGIQVVKHLRQQFNSQILEDRSHQQFFNQFKRLSLKQEKIAFIQFYALKFIIRVQLAKFIYNLLSQYIDFRKCSRIEFVNFMKNTRNFNGIDQIQIQKNIDKIFNKFQEKNSIIQVESSIFEKKIKSLSSVINSKADSSLKNQPRLDDTKYPKNICMENLQFGRNQTKYNEFKKLFYKNAYLLPNYLANHWKRPLNIVTFFTNQQWKKHKNLQGFTLMMEKGTPVDQKYICSSRERFLSFIYDIGNSMIELEETGIFHADIELKNIIAVGIEGITFKLIDFGYAFKVKLVGAESQILSVHKNMLELIKLSFKCLDESQDAFLFEFIFKTLKQSLVRRKIAKIVDHPQRVTQFFLEIERHSKLVHLASYCKLVQGLIKYAQKYTKILQIYELKQINYKIQRLKKGKLSYSQILQFISKIRQQQEHFI